MNQDEFQVAECGQNSKDDGRRMIDVPRDSSLVPRSLFSRREFLQNIGGGIIIFFTVGGTPTAEGQKRGKKERPDFNAYLRIGQDGKVTCFTGKVELGQGVVTSLAQTLADELDVPLQSVDMVMGDTARCPYDAGTWGSMTTP